MNDILADIAWGAVPIATVAYYLLGAAWFTPLFGRAWDKSIGYDRRNKESNRFPASYYIVPFISAAACTVVVAVFTTLIGSLGVGGSAAAGAGIGIAIAAATLTNALTPHTPKPFLFAAVTGSYHLVGCTGAGAILGALG